jgi:hypothetical protein
MIEWTKDFVQSEEKDMGKSTALVPATRTQVTDEESQVSQDVPATRTQVTLDHLLNNPKL